ncbi:MAG: NapC/NirT family cytochrome c [Ignavibacteriales bacterium]|jgi:hypothetical protein|nr:NapC/NirT family cytochrome c [Ignavibacteriales bacterium]
MKLKLPDSSKNWISLAGATIALITFSMIVFLFIISSIFDHGNTYLGLIIYVLLPAILLIGLLLIPIGMWIQIRKEKQNIKTQKGWPIIDLNDPKHKTAFTIFSVGTAIFLLASSVGSYEAFHFSESVQFCGTLCHSVMSPEYTAYKNSPHARVACVECHVGSGADWYVRSKLSGLYQVYAVTLGTVPRPIETPISNLRPARETCEECHWPQKFYSRKLVQTRHYLSDDNNSEWDISLLMKIGAPISALGLQEGIHWHINPNVRIEYKSSDKKRETIPWVKYTNLKTGKVTIYKDPSSNLTDEKLSSLETRVVDCMDCHNRPSHNYQPPAIFINNAITIGAIPKELPRIKFAAMEILGKEFSTQTQAEQEIRNYIYSFYKDNYPDIFNNKKELVEKATVGIISEASKNIFPEMKVRWNVYPNNIGHLEFMGCFRCHNDKHKSDDGKLIKKDCNLCHEINAQGFTNKMEYATINSSLDFKHPGNEVGDKWEKMMCVECHTGLNP